VFALVGGPKNLGDAGATALEMLRGWRPKTHYSTSCYRTRFRSFRSNRLGVRMGTKNFGDAGPRPLETGPWLTRKKHATPHPCYPTKFSQSTPNRLGVCSESQKFWGRWDTAPWTWALLTP